MPPASSPGSDLALSRATTRERAARVRYRRALMLMTMTLVVPGSAQLAAGNRQVGQVAITTARTANTTARTISTPTRVIPLLPLFGSVASAELAEPARRPGLLRSACV